MEKARIGYGLDIFGTLLVLFSLFCEFTFEGASSGPLTETDLYRIEGKLDDIWGLLGQHATNSPNKPDKATAGFDFTRAHQDWEYAGSKDSYSEKQQKSFSKFRFSVFIIGSLLLLAGKLLNPPKTEHRASSDAAARRE